MFERIRRGRTSRRLGAGFAALSIMGGLLLTTSGVLAAPSNFVDINNHQPRWSGTGTYDWANGAASNPGNCTHPTSGAQLCPGTNGLFDGGVFVNSTTPPTAPNFIGGSDVSAQTFVVDPLSADHTSCAFKNTSGTFTAITGDPTTYTGSGSETNGDLLSGDTWGNGSVPNKDEISNTYAVGHRIDSGGPNPTVNEIFFGAERIVNNGDSHIDLEFLQGVVSLVPDSTGCAGTFSGDRSQGDMLLSVDFTSGGTFGDDILYQWHCAAEGSTQPATGTVCNPPLHGKSVPHYQQVSNTAVSFGVNGGGNVDCGGWACRNADGTLTGTLLTNDFMEGGIDLNALGFTGCISTFLPHTRSSQSFTAVLKDFALHSFNTCKPATTLTTVSQSATTTHSGDQVTITVKEANTGNVTIDNVNVTGTGCTTWTAATNLNSPDQATTFTGTLAPGQSVNFTCSFSPTTTTAWTATGHGKFNGNDVPTTNETTSGSVTVIHPATTLSLVSAPTSVHQGDSVTITVKEANSGDDTLTNVAVSASGNDNTGCTSYTAATNLNSPDQATLFTGSLAAGQSVNFSCTFTAGSSTITWQATGTGTDSLGAAVPTTGETVSGSISIVIPNTSLDKEATATVSITYTYKEQNTGNVPLHNVSVSDDKCSTVTAVLGADNVHNIGDTNNNGLLDTTETWSFTCTSTNALTVDTLSGTATPSTASVQNTATGSGVDTLGSTITYCTAAPNSTTICSSTERDQATVSVSATKP